MNKGCNLYFWHHSKCSFIVAKNLFWRSVCGISFVCSLSITLFFLCYFIESFSRSHPFDTMSSHLDSMSKHYTEVRTELHTLSCKPWNLVIPRNKLPSSFFSLLCDRYLETTSDTLSIVSCRENLDFRKRLFELTFILLYPNNKGRKSKRRYHYSVSHYRTTVIDVVIFNRKSAVKQQLSWPQLISLVIPWD